MSSSLPGNREVPASRYDLSTYCGRVLQSAEIADPRTLFTSSTALEDAKSLLNRYKTGALPPTMTPELWAAKRIVDATLHPDTGEAVFLPFRMSCFVLSNLIVTAGMLTPGLGTTGTVVWQVINQSLNVGINASNANKSSPLSTKTLVKSYCIAVSSSVSVALGLNAIVPRLKSVSPSTKLVLGRLVPFAAVASAGAINVFAMRGEEIRSGIDVFPALNKTQKENGDTAEAVGRSQKAAVIAVGETAISRVTNATPIMVLPPLVLMTLQKTTWLRSQPKLLLPVNLGLILTTSMFALPLALAIFPQRQQINATKLEKVFWENGGENGMLEFNRGI